MKDTHELGKWLLEQPNLPIDKLFASIDIESGVNDKHGDEIIAKLYGHSLIEAFTIGSPAAATPVTNIALHFETSASSAEGIHVGNLVKSEATKNAES
ncbi:TPA: hypothetical protein I7730_15960 [Vibrio vulnificus]|uniref:Uncharacterized protein n=1 Tax=Vibrio vulnificus TaxID=672 RepID=A0A8H9N1W7_VIBVL|nr:hypothetical protein [Vibrio vulnificus]HAS8541278.1 hypothetical protein [Vibrio vulnificus]